jgi:cbb3-type cytochrome oxidase subunit 3
MNKLKGLLPFLLGIVLVVFAMENKQPSPPLVLFKYELAVLPTFAIIYACLALGFFVGWGAHALRARRKRLAAAAAASAPEPQEPR